MTVTYAGPLNRSKTPRPPRAVALPDVRAPFRAERKGALPGVWRNHIEEAMADARQLGTGARVVSENGVLLARFENAMKYAPKKEREREPEPNRIPRAARLLPC